MTEPVVDAWHALPAGARRSLELAHESLLAGGLAVGAALTTANGDVVVAAGRNRAYDPPTGVDPLEATPLAHAEMNALARLPTATAAGELAIWSTEQPCAMCQAALDFIGVPVVHVIATDPSDRSRPARPALGDVWVVLATALFLVGPLRRSGGRHPMVAANAPTSRRRSRSPSGSGRPPSIRWSTDDRSSTRSPRPATSWTRSPRPVGDGWPTRRRPAAPAIDDGVVPTVADLLAVVDDEFAVTGRGLRRWPDPHPDRTPRDDEYSRVTDAARWRIVGARADAWLAALVRTGVAAVRHDVPVAWADPATSTVVRTAVAIPLAPGALGLAVGRSRIGDVADAGVTLGVGDPTMVVGLVPDCGCDACDSGSADELDHLDQTFADIVDGRLRRLWRGSRTITVRGDGWSATGPFGRDEVERILADPVGWSELHGASWLGRA